MKRAFNISRVILGTLIVLLILYATNPAPAWAAAPLGPQDPRELETYLDGVINTQMQQNPIAGVTVSVVKDGQLFFAKGYGYADVARQIPVNPETTLFRIGSISKTFTWTAVMQLVEQGKIDLNADVNTYLDFKIPATYPQPITMINLMTHTPGFEDRSFGMIAAAPDRIPPLGHWLATHIPSRVRPPGEFQAYSNYGATLAGYIVERVSGIPYDDYIDRNILQPLGMAHTTSRQPLPDFLVSAMSEAIYSRAVCSNLNPSFWISLFRRGHSAPAQRIWLAS